MAFIIFITILAIILVPLIVQTYIYDKRFDRKWEWQRKHYPRSAKRWRKNQRKKIKRRR